MYEIEHYLDKKEFVVNHEGFKAVLSYEKPEEATIDFVSTKVAFQLRGNGLGKILVDKGIEYASKNGYKIIASCPFVAELIEKNELIRE